jgi:hypothetical protein
MHREQWSVCEHHASPCLYTESGREAMERRTEDYGHPVHCVKHRAFLRWAHDLYGLTRADARKKLNLEKR